MEYENRWMTLTNPSQLHFIYMTKKCIMALSIKSHQFIDAFNTTQKVHNVLCFFFVVVAAIYLRNRHFVQIWFENSHKTFSIINRQIVYGERRKRENGNRQNNEVHYSIRFDIFLNFEQTSTLGDSRFDDPKPKHYLIFMCVNNGWV